MELLCQTPTINEIPVRGEGKGKALQLQGGGQFLGEWGQLSKVWVYQG